MNLQRRKTKKIKHLDSLLIHGRVGDFMSKPPITMEKHETLDDAKVLMRKQRISGIPIVDNEMKLLGLITIENIIMALEKQYINDMIEKHMVTDVVSISEDMPLSEVMSLLLTYPYGRYPVVDAEHKVVGVVTKGDLMEYLYARLGNIYMHNKVRDDVLGEDEDAVQIEQTRDESKDFTYIIEGENIDQAGQGATKFKHFLKEQGCSKEMTRRAGIALYEAEVNVVLHAGGVGFIKGYLKDGQIFIVIMDHGPGIDDIELAMQPGWTTASDEARERGFGAGMGLSNIQKFTDKLVILSSCSGVKIEMVIMPRDSDGGKAIEDSG